jgi:hypothetical protein
MEITDSKQSLHYLFQSYPGSLKCKAISPAKLVLAVKIEFEGQTIEFHVQYGIRKKTSIEIGSESAKSQTENSGGSRIQYPVGKLQLWKKANL